MRLQKPVGKEEVRLGSADRKQMKKNRERKQCMRKTILYIAMSVDGYIAESDGNVAFLESGVDETTRDSYPDFIENVDTILMGWNTYEQVSQVLSPGQWPYSGIMTYVITHRSVPDEDGIHFIQEDPCTLVKKLRNQPGKNIWICGGASLVQTLLKEELIDEFEITVVPVLLSEGIRLFQEGYDRQNLHLVSARQNGQMAELTWTRRQV